MFSWHLDIQVNGTTSTDDTKGGLTVPRSSTHFCFKLIRCFFCVNRTVYMHVDGALRWRGDMKALLCCSLLFSMSLRVHAHVSHRFSFTADVSRLRDTLPQNKQKQTSQERTHFSEQTKPPYCLVTPLRQRAKSASRGRLGSPRTLANCFPPN